MLVCTWYAESTPMARLVAKSGHPRDVCYDEIGVWTMPSKHRHHYWFNNQGDWQDFFFKRKRIFTLTSYKLCISIMTLKLEMIISWSAIVEWMRQLPIWSHGQDCTWSWKVPMIGWYALQIIFLKRRKSGLMYDELHTSMLKASFKPLFRYQFPSYLLKTKGIVFNLFILLNLWKSSHHVMVHNITQLMSRVQLP